MRSGSHNELFKWGIGFIVTSSLQFNEGDQLKTAWRGLGQSKNKDEMYSTFTETEKQCSNTESEKALALMDLYFKQTRDRFGNDTWGWSGWLLENVSVAPLFIFPVFWVRFCRWREWVKQKDEEERRWERQGGRGREGRKRYEWQGDWLTRHLSILTFLSYMLN